MKNFFQRQWKEICAIVLMAVSGLVLGFQIYIVVKGDSFKTLKISNMGSYYTKLDPEAQTYVKNNIFSVKYPWTDPQSHQTFTVFGTCWSIYHDEHSWYLMTNEHVIDEIVNAYKNPFLEKLSLLLSGNFIRDPNTNEIIGRSVTYHQPMMFKSEVGNGDSFNFVAKHPTVICTRLKDIALGKSGPEPDESKWIFAGVKGNGDSGKFLQIDMALIKLCYNDITFTKTDTNGQTTEISPSEWVKKNTYNSNNDFSSKLKDNMPVTLTNIEGCSHPVYYTGGYPYSKVLDHTTFTDGILDGKITRKTYSVVRRSNKDTFDVHAANTWNTVLPFEENDPGDSDPRGWKMQGGSSGSPLIELVKKANGLYGINQKMPVAIYWGGTLKKWRSKEVFFPTFDLFRSPKEDDPHLLPYDILTKMYSVVFKSKKPVKITHF